eukprot:TRINITY_DN257_c0_g2_i1.p1 TRINITY_DN257_c0_g2~~TRINITY_DN257_c0_g2_i1.p1  ORF type:complete len:782 (-),score=436.30 TRINITY_DN257_c0_g2_i1:86-2431(-)
MALNANNRIQTLISHLTNSLNINNNDSNNNNNNNNNINNLNFKNNCNNYENKSGNGNCIETIEKERNNCSFDIRELTYFLDGNEENTQFKELILSTLEMEDVFLESYEDLSREQSRETTMRKLLRVVERRRAMMDGQGEKNIESKRKNAAPKQTNFSDNLAQLFYDSVGLFDTSLATRLAVHFGLFGATVLGQGTDEQRAQYFESIDRVQIFGCFCMTELGHGSYVKGIETTATFDLNTDEFIINSPTLTSTKWWIGALAETATHAVVYARLILKGNDYGPHVFIVQLRNVNNGEILDGRIIGDCGTKMGRNGLDNGWAQFRNVRIPRQNMLMRWATVSTNGEYIKPPKQQLSYASLLAGRVNMVQTSSDVVKKAITIAIRYASVRRQFHSSDTENQSNLIITNLSNQLETPLIDYQTHQFRLLPLLSGVFAFHFTGAQIQKLYDKLLNEIESENLDRLADVHSTSAGLKAIATWWANSAIEQCRQCCGGHGYSAYSGFPSMLADFGPMVTWEGDNTVLILQTARALINAVRNSNLNNSNNSNNSNLNSNLNSKAFNSYLFKAHQIINENKLFKIQSISQLNEPSIFIEAYQTICAKNVLRVFNRFENLSQKLTRDQAWNECAIELVDAAKLHCFYFVTTCFAAALEEAANNQNLQKNGVYQLLNKLFSLWACTNILDFLPYFMEDGFIQQSQILLLRENVRNLLNLLRKDAVSIVDAFNLPDFILCSALGKKDGDIYQNYFDRVNSAPKAKGKSPYWDQLIAPLVNPSISKENVKIPLIN